jgi:hypothetical protein
MAEKRRLSTRERREPAAKRRASEAPQLQSQSQQPPTKKKASIAAVPPTPTPPPPPVEVVETPLPTKIKDGDALPTVPSAQSETLSPKEYQSIAERYDRVLGFVESSMYLHHKEKISNHF